jgi:uncharacterized protein
VKMFAAALALALLTSGEARAFDCTGVKLPSSLVICSDPELMRLADERQKAINEAMARLDPQQQKELMVDQNGWVRSYATACGAPPSRAAPSPVPDAMKECFKQAAQARIAYVRSYGLPAPDASLTPIQTPTGSFPTGWIGPSFDCTKAVRPLAVMICASPELSRDDLRFVQAYQALRQQVGDAGQRQLRQEAADFDSSVRSLCGVPEAGMPAGSPDCVGAQYNRQLSYWVGRLTGAASEEANRGIDRHVALQRDLCGLGYCAPADIAGVYGPGTRTAIIAWQKSRGKTATGLIDDADAAAIEQEALKSQVLSADTPPNPPNVAPSPPLAAPNPRMPSRPPSTEVPAEHKQTDTDNSAATYVVFIGLILTVVILTVLAAGISTPERRKSLARILRAPLGRPNVLAEKRWLDGSELLVTKNTFRVIGHKSAEAYELVFVRKTRHHNPEYFPISAKNLARAAFETRLGMTDPTLPSGLAPALDEVFEPTSNNIRTKNCPLCAQQINATAAVCPFCAYEFTDRSKASPESSLGRS